MPYFEYQLGQMALNVSNKAFLLRSEINFFKSAGSSPAGDGARVQNQVLLTRIKFLKLELHFKKDILKYFHI
jgi:hypothetical protein